MKIEKDGNDLIVFLNNKKTEKIDFKNKVFLEKYFQKLFLKINDIYGLDMCGSYEIVLYNNSYGLILEIRKQDIDYFDYYNEINMQITISNDNDVLYKIKDCLTFFNNYDTYIYNGDIYIKPISNDFINIGIVVENSEIIYGKKAKEILNNASKVDNSIVQFV